MTCIGIGGGGGGLEWGGGGYAGVGEFSLKIPPPPAEMVCKWV